jgi:hypothetical protein
LPALFLKRRKKAKMILLRWTLLNFYLHNKEYSLEELFGIVSSQMTRSRTCLYPSGYACSSFLEYIWKTPQNDAIKCKWTRKLPFATWMYLNDESTANINKWHCEKFSYFPARNSEFWLPKIIYRGI